MGEQIAARKAIGSGPAARVAEAIPTEVVPAPGTSIGRYRLCFELGSGGMGTVFLAATDAPGGERRFVALKCLRLENARHPEFASMFLDEVTIAARVQHPQVCSVIDVGESDGVVYLVMEYLSGESVSAVRSRLFDQLTAWTPAAQAALVARIIADASEGLHAAHELRDARGEPAEVVHRDVAPDNIMIDFGIAKRRGRHHETRPGIIKGKYSYLAPEVLDGQPANRRSDVWGLGVVMWELLIGERLFDAPSDVEAIRAVGRRPIVAPSRLRAGLPAGLDRIVLKALDRDPARRHATARELAGELNRFLANRRCVFGLAEMEEAMQRMFPHGREAKQQLLEAAAEVDAQNTAIIPLDSCDLEMVEPVQSIRPDLVRIERSSGPRPAAVRVLAASRP
jgi:serine/threonine protein kinase